MIKDKFINYTYFLIFVYTKKNIKNNINNKKLSEIFIVDKNSSKYVQDEE